MEWRERGGRRRREEKTERRKEGRDMCDEASEHPQQVGREQVR